MNLTLAFNFILIFGLLGVCFYLLYRYTKRQERPSDGDVQLKTLVRFMNASLLEMLDRLTRPIDDALHNEYSDNMHYLREQAGRHLTIVTDFNTWATAFSGYPGWAAHIASIDGDYEDEDDYYKPWVITASAGHNDYRKFVVPQQNIAHLIDCLESMNNYNEKLIDMIKASEE